MLSFLLSLALTGLIIGALGRLAIPGRNPMSIGMTMLLGVGGSLLGGLISRAIGSSGNLAFVIAVLCAAGLVYLFGNSRSPTRSGRGRGLL